MNINLAYKFIISLTEVYPEPCQKSNMKRYAKLVIGIQPLTIFAKHMILDIWLGSDTPLFKG